MLNPNFKIIQVGTLDHYQDCTIPAGDWLEDINYRGYDLKTLIHAYGYLSELKRNSFSYHNEHEACSFEFSRLDLTHLREEPRVGYSYANDSIFFLFKFDNNGTTILIEVN